jgi:hypothetical protein
MESFFSSLKTERTAAKHTRPVKADMPIARPGAGSQGWGQAPYRRDRVED